MFNNDTQYSNPASWNFTDGMTVYATNGEKIGTVRNYDLQAGYLDVQRGWLFKKDFYVPLDQVDAVTTDGITLKLTKDDLEDNRFSSPPVPSTAKPEPLVLPDGSVVSDPTEIHKLPPDEADASEKRNTVEEVPADWPNRP